MLGSPSLVSARINLENGKQFKVLVKNQSESNVYVQSVKLNGETITQRYINQSDIVEGGVLTFYMGNSPNQ